MITATVLSVFIICATVLVLAFRLTNSSTAEYNAAVDQLIEDHQVFQEGLNSAARKFEEQERQIEELKRKLGNVALGKVKL